VPCIDSAANPVHDGAQEGGERRGDWRASKRRFSPLAAQHSPLSTCHWLLTARPSGVRRVNQRKSARRKWFVRAVKLVIVVVVFWAIRRTLHDAWSQLWSQSSEHRFEWQPGWLVVAGGLYLVGLFPAAIFWHRVLSVLGQEVRFGETLRAYYVGHLGKYVPGKAMVVIIRTGMVRGARVNTAIVAVSVFVETLTMMAVGAFLAAAILAVWFRAPGLTLYGSIGLMVVAGLPTLPPVFKRLVRLAGVGKSDPAVGQRIDKLGYRTLLAGWLLMTVTWVLLGLSYWATLHAMGVPALNPLRDLPYYTASVSLAMVAGFLLFVLPGGLWIREAALVEVMIPYLGHQLRLPDCAQLAAWASAAVLRLVWVVSELAISAALYWRRPAKI
jgi:hypothetical protein